MKKSKLFLGSIALLSTVFALGSCDKDKDEKSESVESSDVTTGQSTSQATSEATSEASSSEEVSLPYETVKTELIADNFETGVFTADKKYGIMKISTGSEITNRIRAYTDTDLNKEFEWSQAFRLDKANKVISFTTPKTYVDPDTGDYSAGKLILYVQNGSSGLNVNNVKIQNVGDPTDSQVIDYSTSEPVVKLEIDIPNTYMGEDEESLRTYNITMGNSGKTTYLYQMSFEAVYDTGTPTSFEIYDCGTTDFMIGQDYSYNDMILLESYDNGKIEQINLKSSDVTFDTTAYNNNTVGTYDLSVKYKDYDAQTYKINVLEPKEITLGFNCSYLSEQKSNAGNTKYVNGKAQTIYSLNEEFDETYINASVVAELGDSTKEFLVTTDLLEFSGFDSSTTGVKTITAKYKYYDISATFDVTVVNTTVPYVDYSSFGKVYSVYVDDDYTGADGEIATIDGMNSMQFKTIGAALEVLEKIGLKDNGTYDTTSDAYKARKLLRVAAGYYNEKLEINVPNLTILGAGACQSTHSEDVNNWDETAFNNATVIEWDSLYGMPDEGGFWQVTDSCQTVAIRDTAIGCEMEGVTLSNYWNNEKTFNTAENLEKLAKYSLYLNNKVNEHRALALLCQADKFSMNDCALLGYQDTVEFFYGRQNIQNSYISGCTDFIFGTNNTTYFNKCEIRVIEKANSSSYITAMKGYNKEGETVKYGVIFNYCDFTADTDSNGNSLVGDGTSSIGRTWGKCATVMTMNCTLGKHISKVDGTRYLTMNTQPTESTVRYTEYNNTGDAAVTSGVGSVNGFTVLTDETEALKYADYDYIFADTNDGTTYDDAWSGYGVIVNVSKK
ncbi:MAG: hypothetical protein K6E20_02655 [Acholeplasmatales bacterium]|nr:hypothetical protein [Acholeplasmatales bacterium]